MKLFDGNKVEDKKYIDKGGIHYVEKMTEEQINALGHYKVSFEAKPNRRYYTATEKSGLQGNVYVIGYEKTPVDVETLKADMIGKVKDLQAKKLADLDWYWLREQKIGTPVPQEIKDLAASIYETATTKETEINALTDVAGCELYENTPVQVEVENEEGQKETVTQYVNKVTNW